MIEFGSTLKAAREAKGLTPAQLAQTTHLMAQQIEALENEDFSKIAAPIYGRGFVRLYCEAVGLDPKPMIAEFMEIFSGNRQPAIRMRTTAATPVPAAPMPQEPTATEPPVHAAMPPPGLDDLGPLSETTPAPEPAPAVEEVAPQPTQDFFLESEVISKPRAATVPAQEPEPQRPFETNGLLFPQEEIAPTPPSRKPSRFTAPSPIDDDDGSFRFTLPHIPRKVWRILALALGGLLALWLICTCISALAGWGSGSGTEQQEESATAEAPKNGTTETTVAPGDRSETAISPIYID